MKRSFAAHGNHGCNDGKSNSNNKLMIINKKSLQRMIVIDTNDDKGQVITTNNYKVIKHSVGNNKHEKVLSSIIFIIFL